VLYLKLVQNERLLISKGLLGSFPVSGIFFPEFSPSGEALERSDLNLLQNERLLISKGLLGSFPVSAIFFSFESKPPRFCLQLGPQSS
jgi:hypothetical protein